MSLFSRMLGRHPSHTDDSTDLIRANIESGKALMLDVRSQAERDAGHLKDSLFISITTIQSLPGDTSELPGLDKEKIVYCH